MVGYTIDKSHAKSFKPKSYYVKFNDDVKYMERRKGCPELVLKIFKSEYTTNTYKPK
jgi:hypothetical protein